LLLDSSGAQLVCALADGEGVIAEDRHPTGSELSRDIGAVAGRLLGELLVSELEAVVVGTGPGSFIGTRVAISYANGLGAGGAVPLYGAGSLAAIAAVYGSGRTVVLRDARRGESYWYGPEAGDEQCRLVALEALPAELSARGVATVVVEQTPPVAAGRRDVMAELLHSASQAGAQAVTCAGVPAEGLRRAMVGSAPLKYIEPVYLRGFL
jgi:tRNA threonylcarbamoyl adenosine modification protein YeaZ